MKKLNSLSPAFLLAYYNNQNSVTKDVLEDYLSSSLQLIDNQVVKFKQKKAPKQTKLVKLV